MKTTRIFALLAAAALAGGLSACSGAASGGGSGSSQSAAVNGIDTSECPDGFNTEGITDTEIKVGASAPLSGPAAAAGAVSVGTNAYFDMINAAGGVTMSDGKTRKLVYTVMDDGYEPAHARSNVDQMINGDKVFTLVGDYGTPENLAVRDLVAEACIPNMLPITGDNELGNPDYPWSAAPTLSAYPGEILAAVETIKTKAPNAKIAVLKQNDDLGNAYFALLENAIEGTGLSIAEVATFDPTDTAVSAQITTLAGSGADAFAMLAGAGTYQLQALTQISQSAWKPKMAYLTNFNSTFFDQLTPEAAKNVYFSTAFKSTKDPAYANDPIVRDYLTWWNKQQGSSALPADSGLIGWQVGAFFVDALERAKEPTRLGYVDAVTHMTWDEESIFLPGIKYSIDYPDQPFGIQSLAIATYDPTGPAGRKYKPDTVVDNTGKIHYQKLD